MSFGLLNVAALLGLAALALPVLIHLLSRRRFDVVDWGAMQFLRIGRATRRRLLLEELLLLALRLGILALVVLALAAPFVEGPALANLGGEPGRDIVLIVDGSASMGREDGRNPTPQEAARNWARQFLDALGPWDAVAVFVAGEQPLPILPELTHDHEQLADRLTHLPLPYGGCDGPGAVQEALKLLAAQGQQPGREVIVLTDGQRQGWADATSLRRWEGLAGPLGAGGPRVWVVDVGRPSPAGEPVPNYTLAPLRPARRLVCVGQPLRVRTALAVTGRQSYQPPYLLRLEEDGKSVAELPPPPRTTLQNGQIPFTFRHRFRAPGVHLLSVVVEPDPPPGKRIPGAPLRDEVPGDNRQDLAIEVSESLPVLLVDGDPELTPEGSTYFLRKALDQSPAPGRPGPVLVRAVPAPQFTPGLLATDLDRRRQGSRPRVLVLADVPRLSPEQNGAVEQFLRRGGGVLVALGRRVAPSRGFYNRELFQDGKGWLPARLDSVAGDPGRPEQAAAVDRGQLHHPALELFREGPPGTLDRARLPRWWKVHPAGPSTSVGAVLTTGDALLVERPYGKGKVVLWAGPLDRSWGADLPGSWEFPVLAHELAAYLADTRRGEYNVTPGQPLRYQPAADDPAARLTLPTTVYVYPPDGEPRPVQVEHWPLVYDGARAAGVYKLSPAEGRPAYFVVQPDPRESDLTVCSQEDRDRVAAAVPVRFERDMVVVAEALAGPTPRQDLWWLALVGVLALLCGELWLTRRMAAGREG